MTVSMTLLGINILRALVFGIFLGASYDVIRIIRVMLGASSYGARDPFKRVYEKGIKNVFCGVGKGFASHVTVFITDIIYFTFAGAAFSVFLFCFNYGIFRWFIFIFALLGFLIYYFTVGRLVVGFSEEISRLIMLILNLAIFTALLPLRFLRHVAALFFRAVLSPAINKTVKAIDIGRKKRYTVKCTEKLSEIVKFKL